MTAFDSTSIDQKTLEAMRRLVQYLEESERRNYEEGPESERRGHIYESVIIVRDWLNPPAATSDRGV
jgi:hypothetical protein